MIPNSDFTVSRTAYKDNSSVYNINDKKATAKDVIKLLLSHGIDLDHNRFLILQVCYTINFLWQLLVTDLSHTMNLPIPCNFNLTQTMHSKLAKSANSILTFGKCLKTPFIRNDRYTKACSSICILGPTYFIEKCIFLYFENSINMRCQHLPRWLIT